MKYTVRTWGNDGKRHYKECNFDDEYQAQKFEKAEKERLRKLGHIRTDSLVELMEVRG